MNKKFLRNATELGKHILNQKLENGMVVVDATVGNGYDTLNLAKLIGDKGKVYGFDIQKKAINITKNRLIENHLLNRVELINDSHETINQYIKEKIDLAIFNLGYLPGGDHSIITRPASTIESIKSILNILKDNGLIVVVSYYGHEEGLEEKNQVERFLSHLDQKYFTTLKLHFINQINNPPIVYCVEKIK